LQLLLKSHKLTIVLPTPLIATLPDIKSNALSALKQFSDVEARAGVPVVEDEDAFQICRKNKKDSEYLLLEGKKTAKEMGLGNWEILYLRFRDADGTRFEHGIQIFG
jgi:hypothetical protein